MSIYFIVQDRSLQIRSDILRDSPYFTDLLKKNQNYHTIRITVPDWMSYRHLELYFSLMPSSNFQRLDIFTLQKLLWISDYFQNPRLQEVIISEILPLLQKDTVLHLLQDSSVKIQSGDYSQCWKDLYNHCKELTGKNLRYILVQFPEIFEKLNSKTAEEVIEESLQLKFFTTADHSALIDRLRDIRQTAEIAKLIADQEKNIQDTPLVPVHSWELNAAREKKKTSMVSEIFAINNINWQLISRYNEGTLEISIKLKENILDRSINLALYLQCLISSENPLNIPPKLMLLPVSFISECVIREIPLSSNYNLVVSINARIDFIYSAMIQDVLLHPDYLLAENISELSFECLEFLLSLNTLNVKSEDNALEILGKWCEETSLKPNENDMKTLLICIRWDFVGLKYLVSSISRFPILKKYLCFREIFKKELRNKGKAQIGSDKPRYGYKEGAIKENFQNQREFVESIAEILLDLEFPLEDTRVQGKIEEDEEIREMNHSIVLQEEEIGKLRNRYSSLKNSQEISFSPFPIVEKLTVSGQNFNRIPSRLRGSSLGSSLLSTYKPSSKSNMTGKLLSSLLRKISAKK